MQRDIVSLPKSVKKYFWGDNLRDLSWPKHQKYIIQTILEKGDAGAISWLLAMIDKDKLRSSLSTLNLSDKSRNFWLIYLS